MGIIDAQMGRFSLEDPKVMRSMNQSKVQKSQQKVGMGWKCWVAGKSNVNYKQGFCTNAEVFIMDEGIEMMPI